MIFKDCHPGLSLQSIVEVYRLRHFIIPKHVNILPKPYPTRPEQCMAFYIKGFEITEACSLNKKQRRPRAVISGQYTQLINRYSGSSEFLMIQVVFLPGALFRLTGIPAKEFQDQHIDLELIFPVECKRILEKLNNCSDYGKMIEVIEEFLIRIHLQSRREEHRADQIFRIMLQHPGKYSINWLAREACLSHRQFERKAYDLVGISPKLFARISRFIQSYDLKLKNKEWDWLSIAIMCNYHDYQHLAKDYKEFSNLNPNALFTAESYALERRLGLHS